MNLYIYTCNFFEVALNSVCFYYYYLLQFPLWEQSCHITEINALFSNIGENESFDTFK